MVADKLDPGDIKLEHDPEGRGGCRLLVVVLAKSEIVARLLRAVNALIGIALDPVACDVV